MTGVRALQLDLRVQRKPLHQVAGAGLSLRAGGLVERVVGERGLDKDMQTI